MPDKPAAVVPITPHTPRQSEKAGSIAPRITAAEFGERLRRGREQKQRSLEEIAETTKIAIHQLRSLERGELDRLPAGLYCRAIVRQYAAAIGLNVDETLGELARVGRQVDGDARAVQGVVPPAGAPRANAASSLFSTALSSSAAPLVLVAAFSTVATVWNLAGPITPVADVPVTAASVPTPAAAAPAVARAAATEAAPANAGDIQLATEPAVLPDAQETTDIAAANATEGELQITSEPAGAQVTINGIGWGVTPVTIPYMPFGKKVIRATKPGYVSAQRGFDFVPGRRVRSVRIQLSPDTR